MKAVLLYSTHGMHAIVHDNHVRMVCIDTYEEYTVCFTNGVANIHIDLDNNFILNGCGLGVA